MNICKTVYERMGINLEEFDLMMQGCSGNTISEIANKFNIDNTTSIKYARIFGVQYKINVKLKSLDKKLGISKQELKQVLQDHLNEDMSIPQIAKIYNISSTAIHNYMKRFNLSRRSNLRNPEWLKQRYLIDRISSEDIASECGVTGEAVRWHLKKNNIKIRTLSEAQQIANEKRDAGCFVNENGRNKSRGYMIRYNNNCFRSAAEYLWYKINKKKYKDIGYEVFVFENKRPDFLVEKKRVVEVKRSRKDMTDDEYDEYKKYGNKLELVMGYKYEIIFVKDEYPEEYDLLIRTLQDMGSKPSIEFSLLEEI